MLQQNCYICCNPLPNDSAGSTKSSLKSVFDIVGISYKSFVGDLLENEDDCVNFECLFCARCCNLINVADDLKKSLRVVKQKFVDRIATGYQRRRSTQIVKSFADRKASDRLAERLGQCCTRSVVFIRPEDKISVDQSQLRGLTAAIKQEQEQLEIVFLDNDFEADSNGSDSEEQQSSAPPVKKKPRGNPDGTSKLIYCKPSLKRVADSENAERSPSRKCSSNDNSLHEIGHGHVEAVPVLDEVDNQKQIANIGDIILNESSSTRDLRPRTRKKKLLEEVDLSSDGEALEAGDNDFDNNDDSSDESESSASEKEDKTFDNTPKRSKKRAKENSDTGRFPCGTCGMSFLLINVLEKHIIKSHEADPLDRPYGCAVCPAGFQNAEDLKKHVIYYTIAKGRKADCLLCEFSDDLCVLIGHYYKEHGLDFLKCKYFGCIRCRQTFKSIEGSVRSGFVGPDDLPAFRRFAEEHRTCTPPKELNVPQQCRICSETRFTAADLISHETVHFSDLQCTFCDFELESEHELKVHSGKYHKRFQSVSLKRKGVSVRLPNQPKSQRVPRKFACSICDKRFAQDKSLENHLKRHAAGESLDPKLVSTLKEVRKYQCPLCKFQSTNVTMLAVHMNRMHCLMHYLQLDSSFYNCYICCSLFEPSDSSELPGRLLPKDVDKLKEFTTEHEGCNREVVSEFTCPRCSKKFSVPKSLFSHCMECMQDKAKMYQCTECASEFESNVEYLLHIRQEHEYKLKFQCQCYKCGKTFKNFETLKTHVQETSQLLQCPGCEQNFNGSEAFKKHKCKLDQVPALEEVTATEVPPRCAQLNGGFPCLSCQKTFDTVALLSLHFQEHHDKNEQISFNCGICSTELTSSETLRKNGDKTFYSAKNSLIHPDFTMLCTHHWKYCISNPESAPCHEIPQPSFECYICNQVQDSPQNLAAHLNEHHGCTEVQKCPGCTLLFREKTKLHTHLRRGHGLGIWACGRDRYACFGCNQPFNYSNPNSELGIVSEKDLHEFAVFLEQHFLCKAEKIKPKCSRCFVLFSDKEALYGHEMSVHTKIFDFYCEHCGKGFPSVSHLNSHRKTVHEKKPATEERERHACHICSKSFLKPSYLQQHLRSHEKQPPMVCQYCGKGFAIRSIFYQHERRHLEVKPTEPTVPCPICGKLFLNRVYMKYHVTWTHEKRLTRKKRSSTKETQVQNQSNALNL